MEIKIYTKTGDDGTTGLLSGTRVSKTDPRLEAYGTIDELNSWIGLIRSSYKNNDTDKVLIQIQETLFDTGSILANDNLNPDIKLGFRSEMITILEKEMDRMHERLPVLRNFILPGGTTPAAYCHLARTVCRRAERRIVSLNKISPADKQPLVFINRLSDFLFVLSRFINFESGHSETTWMGRKA